MNGMNMKPDRPNGELARRLEAYAGARLSPESAASERMRARVMLAADRRSAPPASPAPAAGPSTPGIVLPFGRHRRRMLSALLAAAFILAMLAGGALAARPGGPLYEARLAVEAAFLPSAADARAEANLGRLEARLGEAVNAAASGNEHAVGAALGAYRRLVDEMAAASGASDVRDAALEAALGHHLDVLNGLLSKVPAEARPGIERAIERSDEAVERILGDGGSQPGPGAKPTNQPPGQSARPDRTPPGQPPGRPSRSP